MIRYLRALGVVVLALWLVYYLVWVVIVYTKSSLWGVDARVYFDAAHAIRRGVSPLGIVNPSRPGFPYLYPPFLAILGQPLSYLPLPVVLWCFCLVATAAALGLVWLFRPLVGWRVACIGVLCWPPLWISVAVGQINLVVVLSSVLAWLAVERRSNVRAGGWFALGIALKIVPLAFLSIALARRRWRLIVATGLALGVIVLACLPWVSVSLWWSSLFQTRSGPLLPWSYGWISVTTLYGSPWFGHAVVVMIGGTTLLRVWQQTDEMSWAALFVLPVLIAPVSWDHSAVLALPTLAILWHRNGWDRRMALGVWLCCAIGGNIITLAAWTMLWARCCIPEASRRTFIPADQYVVSNQLQVLTPNATCPSEPSDRRVRVRLRSFVLMVTVHVGRNTVKVPAYHAKYALYQAAASVATMRRATKR